MKNRIGLVALCMVCIIMNVQHIAAQQVKLKASILPLPAELADANQQFSGLYIANSSLYLLPECRLQDAQDAAIYSVPLSSLDAFMKHTDTALLYKKIPLRNLEVLRSKMEKRGEKYEGTEAIAINGNNFYITVETDTPSPDCLLLKGVLSGNEIVMDTSKLMALPKPVLEDGKHVYNAGFEAIMLHQNRLLCFFEYNNFSKGNHVYSIDTASLNFDTDISISSLPFRITDITATAGDEAVAINYFFKGVNGDEVYRPAANTDADNLVHDSTGYKNYNRLIRLQLHGDTIDWKPFGDMPAEYWSYNLEGIAAYKNGYLIINDKYSDKRPYKSVLLFVHSE